jgi:hypothetical protein
LAGDEGTPKPRIGRQPRRGITKSLVEVDLTGHGQQIARVVGEVAAALVVPQPGTLVPGVGQRHHMVDLHGRGGVGAANEVDGHPGVGVMQDAALREAGTGPHLQIDQIAAQDVVAGVATVVPELDVDVVTPRLTEPEPLEVAYPVPAVDGQRLHLMASRVVTRGRCRRRSRLGLLPCFIAQVEPTGAHRNSDHNHDRQPIAEPAVGSHASCHTALS